MRERAAALSGCRAFALLALLGWLLMAPRVFRAPEGPAAVCAGGRRPAREPSALRASLGASPRSPARPRRRPRAPQPCPTARVSCSTLACGMAEAMPNFARNSPATISNLEFRSLELQRFLTLLKLCSIELRATFLGAWPHRPRNFACNSFAGVSWFEV